MKTHHNFDLTNYNSFRLKSIGKTVYFPESVCELRYILSTNLNCPILADGTNVLLHPQIDKLICLSLMPKVFTKKLNYLHITANIKLQSLVSYTVLKSFGGFENLWGIPGSIGGAIIGNSGSSGTTISDHLSTVKTINHYGQIKTYSKNQLIFKRRYCSLSDLNEIILSATFKLSKDKINKEKIEKMKEWRTSFPKEPNAGGIFKNWYDLKPYEHIIKNFENDNVKIWNKHINVMLNKGNATYTDVIDLIMQINQIVKEPLQLEVKII